ncbi:uncharacterized protein BO80DRAFT_443150 [Aspergillus ibericus CBS 121593]|uniref:Uncharacterized protein n=1 Tax=Aspergillus ibericus CBS 121593 TaxID=1448316 RepID=A0A395H4V9_9EURO|nr:hypothetical protein BO80DRAFT_443150 [Aspergillus ibericus CBS 121593]RAL02901.1 hypothetical protein BO80DRAFT_443150 [Aspergillus ibericus CBS 121593]
MATHSLSPTYESHASMILKESVQRPFDLIADVLKPVWFRAIKDERYNIRRRLNDRAKLHEKHKPDRCRIQREWIKRYKENEDLQFAILQRINCLARIRNRDSRQPENPFQHTPGPSNPKRQVSLLEEHFYRCQKAWKALTCDKPSGPITDEFEFLQHHRNDDGQTLAWEEDKIMCASLGGCCGRSCRCCERPLRLYLMPDGGEKAMVGFYGHCTAECGCCMRHRGFYRPDSRIKALDPELASKIADYYNSSLVEGDGDEPDTVLE